MSADSSFLGRGWGFPPEFHSRGKMVKMAEQEDDIRQSLEIILSTSPGERLMRPTFGCGLKSQVHEVFNENTMTRLKDMIQRSILFFEPRITLDSIEVDTGRIIDGVLQLTLNYTIKATNSRSNMVYPFYFNEGTNIRS